MFSLSIINLCLATKCSRICAFCRLVWLDRRLCSVSTSFRIATTTFLLLSRIFQNLLPTGPRRCHWRHWRWFNVATTSCAQWVATMNQEPWWKVLARRWRTSVQTTAGALTQILGTWLVEMAVSISHMSKIWINRFENTGRPVWLGQLFYQKNSVFQPLSYLFPISHLKHFSQGPSCSHRRGRIIMPISRQKGGRSRGYALLYSTIGSTVHSRPFNSLGHCICTTTMTG